MNRNEVSIRSWIPRFLSGEFDDKSRQTQINAGWFDWFCDYPKLAAKTAKMGKVIAQIKDGGKVDLDKQYVFFKNNCPMVGPLYDDFRICDRETGKVRYCISNRNRKWQVYDIANYNKDDSPNFEGSVSALVKYLNTRN